MRRVAWVVLLVTLAGCEIVDPTDGRREALEQSRARWTSFRPTAYAAVVERLCFCLEEGRGPVRVSVAADTSVRRAYLDTGRPVPRELAPLFPTVDGLFDIIERALDEGAAEVRVSYDGESGIPTDVWIDYDRAVADEELGFRVGVPVERLP